MAYILDINRIDRGFEWMGHMVRQAFLDYLDDASVKDYVDEVFIDYLDDVFID
jgi:hypothetical protein